MSIRIFQHIEAKGGWNPGQLLAINCRKKEVLFQGGFGAGKSAWLLGDNLLTAHECPGMPTYFLRRTHEDVVESCVADHERMFTSDDPDDILFPWELLAGGAHNPKEAWSRAFSINDRRPVLEFAIGSRFMYSGWQTRDGKEDPKKFGSRVFGAIAIEEFSDLHGVKVFNYLSGRCRWKRTGGGPLWNDNRTYNRVTLAGNPPDESHWAHEEFEVRPLKEPAVAAIREFIEASTVENMRNLPVTYISDLEATYSKSWIQRYIHGKTGVMEGGMPVLKHTYIPTAPDGRPWHVADGFIKPLEDMLVWVGTDVGLAFAAAVWAQWNPDLGQIVIHDFLLAHGGAHAIRFGGLMKTQQARMFVGCPFNYYGDPATKVRSVSRGESAQKVLRDYHGIHVRLARTNDWIPRRDAIVELFSLMSPVDRTKPLVVISNHRGTVRLQDALEVGYQYPEGKEADSSIVPMKNQYSHPGDAITYLALEILTDVRAKRLPAIGSGTAMGQATKPIFLESDAVMM